MAFRILSLVLEHQVTQARLNTKFLESHLIGALNIIFIFHFSALSDCNLMRLALNILKINHFYFRHIFSSFKANSNDLLSFENSFFRVIFIIPRTHSALESYTEMKKCHLLEGIKLNLAFA